ncbi:hypothetical protein FHS85_001728 [Rhodoligotrophos appendicifer]|uniref:hypothetical protein n=1 Tax=Rhodoligotrophos appendicifer TaxID=987056 RepID=UPI0011851518|nr:hypothetical protein [Rhodoligotrophos appendicifer]
MTQLIFLTVVGAIVARALLMSRQGKVSCAIVSCISAAVYLTCLWIPAILQSENLIISKIYLARLVALPTPDEVSSLSLRWALELMVILAAEVASTIAAGSTPKTRPPNSKFGLRSMTPWDARRIVIFLMIVGVISTIVLPASSIEQRADGGQGFGVLMRSFLIVGLSMLAFYNFFNSNRFRLAAIAGVLFLIGGSVRSPLLVVLFGYVAGLISRGELLPKRMALLALIAVTLGIFGAFMSNLRGTIIRGEQVSVIEIATQTMMSPYVSIYESGIDTLDGYRLSMMIQPNEEARPLSVFTVFTNFIPRAIWPDKPADLSVEISAKYLNYGAGGQFLSPIGYMSIAFGGYAFALLGLFVFIFVTSRLAICFQNSFVLAVVICIVVRFMMGGAAFDIYYGLTLLIPLVCGIVFIRLLKGLSGGARMPGVTPGRSV